MPNAKKAGKKGTKAGAKKVSAKRPVAKQITNKPAAASKPAAVSARRMTKRKSSGALPSEAPVKGRPSMATKPTTIDEYLDHVDGETKTLLEELRQMIRQLVPDAEECISYSMPAFRWQGKVIGGFAATRAGGSYYPFSGTTLDTLGDALAGYGRTKSGLHFTHENPLPRALVRRLLDARKVEIGH